MKDISHAKFVLNELYAFYNNKLNKSKVEEDKILYKRKIIEITTDHNNIGNDKIVDKVLSVWQNELKSIMKRV